MADAFTTQSSSAASKALWNAAFLKPYRDELHFDQIATPKSTTEGGQRGKSVTFTFINDLAISTTPIDEIVDPDAITYTTSTKTVELLEYARIVKLTKLARTTSFVALDREIVDLVAFNAGSTIDTIVAAELVASAGVTQTPGNAAASALTAADTTTTVELEIALTEFMKNNVPKINGFYNAYLHPYQIHDLRIEAGAVGWRQLPEQTGVNAQNLINGTVGEWAGFRIISANRAPMTADEGAGAVDTFTGILIGANTLVKGYSDHPEAPGPNPKVGFGPVVDALERTVPVTWYALQGYETVRPQGVRLLKTASSRGTNV